MPNIKIINREPAGGENITLRTYDIKDKDEGNQPCEPFLATAGEEILKPGEERELLVNDTRTFSITQGKAATKKSPASAHKIGRDAETGHFKSVEAAKADPDGSTVETIKPKNKGIFNKK